MSAINERELSLIRDEDLLKKMWQESEDFGRKKEIRAHMYKLREERLKDLYCNSDVKDIQITSNSKTSFNQSTHADSLVDHSFASLKSKEIRDSESPTRDINFRIQGSVGNQGWNVSKIDERSLDGKTQRMIQSAETSGTEIIPKGKIDFQAKTKQENTSFQDGDDTNFIKSKTTSTNTMLRQEAVGCDDHSKFKSYSTESSSSSRKVTEQKSSYDTIDQKDLSSHGNVIDKRVKIYTTDAPSDLKTHPGYVEGKTKITRETKTLADGTVVTTTKYETSGANEIKSSNQYSTNTRQDSRSRITSEQHSTQKTIEDRSDKYQPKSRYYVEKTHTIPDNSENIYQNVQSSHMKNTEKHEKLQQNINTKTVNVNDQIEVRITGDLIDDKRIKDETIKQNKYYDEKRSENIEINRKNETRTTKKTQQNDLNSVPLGAPIEIEIDVTKIKSVEEKRFTEGKPQNYVYDTPAKREPIKPPESELKSKTKPTDGQYDTTYRTDYTNKRISMEVSPTHEAFARSLRAVSPDRLSSRTSSKTLRNSNCSLRSSSSPEKTTDWRHPTRMSPSKKTPDRFSSTETITYRSPLSQRSSPEKSQKTTIRKSSYDTITKRRESKSPPKYQNVTEIVTDLDDDISVISKATVTKSDLNRPSTLEYSTRKYKKVTERSPTSPLKEPTLKETPKKERPLDRPLKRKDTYEERCRQILGITEVNEKRRSSLDKLKKRNSVTLSQSDIQTKTIERKSPEKPREKSPSKQGSPLQEFPAQIRRSPEKQTPQKIEVTVRKNSTERTKIQEFPAQIRRSPEKQIPQKSEPKKSPERKPSGEKTIQEFPAQIRRSPEKQIPQKSEPRKSPERKPSVERAIQEFPAHIRKQPEKPQSKEYSKDLRNKILTKEKSPIRDFTTSTISISELKSTNIDTNTKKIQKQHSLDSLDGSKPQKPSDYPFAKDDEPDRCDIRRRKEHIYEEISEVSTSKNDITRKPSITHETVYDVPKTTRKSPEKEKPSNVTERVEITITEKGRTDFHPKNISKITETNTKTTTEKFDSDNTTKSVVQDIVPVLFESVPGKIDENIRKQPKNLKKITDDSIDICVNETNITYTNGTSSEQDLDEKITETILSQKTDVQTRKQSKDFERVTEPQEEKPKETPTKVKKPTENLKNEKKPKKKFTHLDTDESSEDDVEKTFDKKNIKETYEGKTPVKEPLMIKKSVSLLYSDDEEVAVTTQKLIESEITDYQTITDKKKTPKTTTKFLNNEKYSSNIPKTNKKPLLEKNDNKPKLNDKTEYKDKYNAKNLNTKLKTEKQNTLSDIENFDGIKKDNTTHIRNHRIDDTINKPRSPKTDEKITKSVTKTSITSKTSNDTRKTVPSTRNQIIVEKTIRKTPSKNDVKPAKNIKISTTISLKPKIEPSKPKTPIKSTPKTNKKPVESDDESIPDSLNEKINVSEVRVNKIFGKNVVSSERKTPSRSLSKPELIEEKPKTPKPKLEKRCISTKSIIINNTEKGVISDFQRSISSREPTPDKLCPLPVTSDDDGTAPRYPDKVVEPDDCSTKRKPKRLVDTAIQENEDKEVHKIEEITDSVIKKVTEIDKVDKDDESLLTVNKKISKFLTTAEKLTEKSVVDISQPAPKVDRLIFEVDEDLKEDECLLSVSDKVNKFITEAEHLTTQDSNNQRKSVNIDMKSDVTKKINRFTIDAKMKNETQKPQNKKLDRSTLQQDVFITTECEQIEKEEDLFRKNKNESPERISKPKSPVRETQKSTPKRDSIEETKTLPRNPSPKEFTPKNRRPSQEEKLILSEVGRLRSNECIKKAKALFENTETREEKRQKDILSRPSVFDERNKTIKKTIDRNSITPKRLDFSDKSSSPERRGKSPLDEERDIPGYMKPLDRSTRQKSPQKEISPIPIEPEDEIDETPATDDVPGYMKPLDRSFRLHSPKRDVPPNTEPLGTPTKFGVVLKKTDSIKAIINSTTTKKHYILSKKNITEEDIEQIYDLEVLEELLLKVTGYEIRRKIRTQIRYVKKLISENKLEITIQNLRNKSTKTNQNLEKSTKTTKTTEYTDQYTRKTSPQRKLIDNKLFNHSDITDRRYSEKSSEYTSSYNRKESIRSGSPYSRGSKSPERKSPERKLSEKNFHEITTKKTVEPQTKTVNVFKSTLKKTESRTKPPVPNGQPEWVSQRNLKKVNTTETVKKNISSSVTKKQTARPKSPVKEIKSTDIITSSYGVGPMENGAPLFGLKALRAQNKASNTKVKGTVISSQYYSETGKEPIGQISVTKYSSDPHDLEADENLTQDGEVLSITTTQKFGFDDAPTLSQLTSTKKEICDVETDKRTNSSKSSTITRKNSVKALTQKFVENTVEVSKNERQSSYPKAGLILRSSSFKNDSSDDNIRISGEEQIEESVSLTSSRVVSGGTFLRNKSKVSGVQDVITRMKTEDVQVGDTEEDAEARDLLNKFIGSQVILSGIEGHVSKSATASLRTTTSNVSSKSTTKVTTVIKENGKEVTQTRVFEHPISDEVLATVWDEQTLRYLLDQSTDYEERKRIRARLRFLMAEQEACTELVKQASQDQSGQSIDDSVRTTKQIVTEEPVTTTKVTTRVTQQQVSKKPISPFAKFRQLDKQNSLNTPPSTPRTPGGSPLFKFTDAALSQSASTIKDRLLFWCRMKTKEYENIQLDNFSSSWADGLAFCALIHHFIPDAFDYHALTPKERRHNFTLAFKVADEKADIAPLLDVDDMVATRRPDWKCVFTYVQSIYRRFKDED